MDRTCDYYQFDEQDSALQLSFNFQRNALRDATRHNRNRRVPFLKSYFSRQRRVQNPGPNARDRFRAISGTDMPMKMVERAGFTRAFISASTEKPVIFSRVRNSE